MELTPQMRAEYLVNKGNHCPFCKSKDIEGISGFGMNDDEVTATIRCNKCKGEWTDIYTLTDIYNI